jgi:DNA polymerase III gamma/tau subunit
MNTFIISAKTLQNGIDRAILESEKNKIDEFDRQLLEFEKALGIEDVRKIQEKIYLRPFKGDKKAVLVIMSQGATVDAQNAMLKLLEEPPASTLIFLITDNHLAFLPTVLSRTKIIEIKEEKEIDTDGLEKILNLNGAGERLHLAQVISKEKTEAIIWLEQAILSAREKMIENVEDKQEALKLRKLIHTLELTHFDLKTTNANPRLALENLFLSI